MIRAFLSSRILPIACAAFPGVASIAHAGGGVPSLDHVIVVVMENKNYDQARATPYVSSLLPGGSSFSNYHAITHPSQRNYVALWSGSTQGVADNTCPAPGSPFVGENLGHACEAAGLDVAAVNVSAIQFARHDFVDTVAAALNSTGFPARWLELELTEPSLFFAHAAESAEKFTAALLRRFQGSGQS